MAILKSYLFLTLPESLKDNYKGKLREVFDCENSSRKLQVDKFIIERNKEISLTKATLKFILWIVKGQYWKSTVGILNKQNQSIKKGIEYYFASSKSILQISLLEINGFDFSIFATRKIRAFPSLFQSKSEVKTLYVS